MSSREILRSIVREAEAYRKQGLLSESKSKYLEGIRLVRNEGPSRNGKQILWYPDAKCWLLGKEITPEVLSGLSVPE